MGYVETLMGVLRALIALTCLAAFSALAGDAGGDSASKPSSEAVPVSADTSTPAQTAAKEIPVVNDPLFRILSKLKGESNEKADVVDLGDGSDAIPSSGGAWTLAQEEKAPPSVTRGDHQIHPGDPEIPRRTPPDVADPLTDSPAASSSADTSSARTFRPAPGDPESRWRSAQQWAVESIENGSAAPGLAARAAGHVDAPRFKAGVGLDSDAAETVAELSSVAQKPEKENESPASKGDNDAARKAALESLRSAMAQRKAQAKNGKKSKEPEDLEKVFNETIAQIDRERPLIEDVLKKEREEKERRIAQFADLHIRDEHAALVMDALVNKKPLGTVSCKVVDRVSKQHVCARVRLTDITDVPIQAPLPLGFWTDGEFSAQAISGVAKIELSRGRFAPSYIQRVKVQPNVPTVVDAQTDQLKVYDFAARGWYLADLDCGVRARNSEKPVWLGAKPTLTDLCTAARAEGVHILGVPPPWGEGRDAEDPAVLERFQSDDLFLLPVLPGPRHAFHGIGAGLGVSSVRNFPLEVTAPEIPLREGFEEIRSRGGLAIYSQLSGLRNAEIRKEIFPLFPRLEQTNFFGRVDGTVPLFAANELPFDTVTGPSFDVLAFDGSQEAERLWFNLLGHGYPISVVGTGGGSLEGGHAPFGQTLIQLPGKPSRENVLAAVKQGRTVVSFGPAVFVRIAERDMGPGSILPADGRTLSLQLQAYASMIPGAEFSKIEVIRNGEVIRTHEPNAGETLIHSLSWSVNEVAAAWYVLRVTERYTKGAPNGLSGKTATAWSSPIYFRGPSYSPPPPAVSRVSGVLQLGATPCAGKIKAVVSGQPDREVETDANGRYKIDVSSAATLIFEAPNAEPKALRVFEHPRVQRALGRLQAAGMTKEQFEKPALFPAWCLLLSELEWNISLSPSGTRIPVLIHKPLPNKDLPSSQPTKAEVEILQPQR
jgi:hypothetical protein